jgi:predicted amidophosphoribosyltransferase
MGGAARRSRSPEPLAWAAVLLLDDTWTSGGTARSAAMALKRAGARSVVVLGRRLPPVPR